ncbi:MAG TPA: nitrite/sulfite reductase [Vicinamibacterales bacterium]|nr:nitrite/sulfite reductase [Vicinamibacterales bacterium]
MAAVDDPRTLGRARLSFADSHDIDEFADVLGKFERGEITPDEWRAFRLVRGTYGQRQAADAQMLRIKIPQGVLSTQQLHALADVAEQYSRGFGHITTRQNVQFHFVRLHDVELAMRRLADAGLTTREACGNSVRNITACPYAGVGADELFDVTPYAEALTRYLLRHPLSASLPRKFKIGFEGCAVDHAYTGINDIGWRAVIRGDNSTAVRGFRVTVGGGTATYAVSGSLLHEFLPVAETLDVAEAIIRVFHRFGDYTHKHRNRLKFLIKSLGWERFRAAYETAYAEVRAEGGAALPFDPDAPPVESAPDWPPAEAPSIGEIVQRAEASPVVGPGIVPAVHPRLVVGGEGALRWMATNVRCQKQDGFATVTVTVPLGDLTGEQLRILADLSLAFSDGSVRITVDQDLVFRWVPIALVESLYERLAAAGLALPDAGTIADVTSCPGAESCRLAVTQSRGLGKLLGDHLRDRPDLVDAATDVHIKISGCPNGCGQHHVAGIGFQGSIRKLDGRAVPQYFVMVGGDASGDGARFGRLAAKIPARRAPDALERLIALYVGERAAGESATTFFGRVEVGRVKQALADLERLTPEDALPDDFIDLGEDAEFTPEVLDGECSA